MIATQPKTRQILGINQQAYQALKASMSLNLRRQLLIAVCDSVVLQNQLANQLERDLAEKSWLASQARGNSSSLALTNNGTPLSISLKLERLIFDPEDAHLPRQVAHWVRESMLAGNNILPQVQMLGIEQMTRQPAIIQNHFLRSLEQIEALLPRLNTSLLVWVPWPWLRTIQSSSPAFWKWRNGVFEFVSDPTPTTTTPAETNGRSDSTSDIAANNGSDNGRFVQGVSPLEVSQLERTHLENSVENGVRPERPDDSSVVSAAQPAGQTDTSTAIPADGYPTIDTQQVVALYGETDDSDLGDYGQPTLEAIATWDTVDVDATPVYSEEEETTTAQESPDAAPSLGQLRSDQQRHTTPDTAQADTAQANTAQADADQTAVNQLEADKYTQLADQIRADNEARDQKERADAERLETQLAAIKQQLEKDKQNRLPAVTANATTAKPANQSSTPSVPTTAGAPPTQVNLAQMQRAADDYFEVGRSYRARIEAGDRGLNMIEPAIAAYEGGLRCLSGPHPDWGSGLNDLGTLYWLKAQQLSNPQQIIDCMSHSVELYAEALTKIDIEQEPDMACQLYSNMGAVYSMLAMQIDPVRNFQQAAAAYQQSLPLCSLTNNPDEYATLHNSLGSVYWKLSHYDQDPEQIRQHLQSAITIYEQALLGYHAETQPLEYAAVQNNLGITYWSLARHHELAVDAVKALKNAIAAYRDALNYRTPESDPAACAITYNNLALAYWDLSKDDTVLPEPKLRYQRNAVTAFEAALQTASAVGSLSQMDIAAIYHCLGDVHAQMVDTAPSLTEVADSLQKSLHSYVQAIDGMPTASPVFDARLKAIVANLHSHQQHLGLASQQAALNRIPSHLISQVMQAL